MSVLDNIKQQFVPQEVVGCHIQLTKNELTVDAVTLSNKKGVIAQVSDQKDIPLGEIKTVLPENTPVICSIDGKGVIHRKVAVPEDQDLHKLVQNELPNANLEDLFVQLFVNDQQDGFLSIVRLEELQPILDKFEEQGVYLQEIILGAYTIKQLMDLDPSLKELTTKFHQVKFEDGSFREVKLGAYPEAAPVNFQGEELKQAVIIPYANAFSNFLPLELSNSGNLPLLDTNKVQLKHLQIFKKLFKVIPATFFVIFLINFLLYSYYRGENENLQVQNRVMLSNVEQIKSLQQEIKEKKELLNLSNWRANLIIPHFADRLGATVVDGIQLEEIEIYPLDQSKVQEEKIFEFDTQKILVEGMCLDPQPMNLWIKNLMEESWIVKIQDQRYTWDNNRKRGRFSFTIIVSAENDS